MTPLEQAQAALDEAARQMAEAVREAFPVGTPVKCGEDTCTVSAYPGASFTRCRYVCLRAANGISFSVRYTRLRTVEPKEKT